uniref:Uncharacterized protein n=1 Tax=Tetranychus urticae TaxID=32264 RepID=T1JUN3_TETUR
MQPFLPQGFLTALPAVIGNNTFQLVTTLLHYTDLSV